MQPKAPIPTPWVRNFWLTLALITQVLIVLTYFTEYHEAMRLTIAFNLTFWMHYYFWDIERPVKRKEL